MLESSHRLHALVIGVGDYSHPSLPNISVAPADAREIATILRDPDFCGYPPDQVTSLVGERTTLQDVRNGFRYLAENCGPDETAIIYFSGHGGHAEQHVYLCLRDTNPYDLAATALSDIEITAAIRFIRAERLLIILDSCFASGGARFKSIPTADVWEPGFSAEFFEVLSRGNGRVLMASSREDQLSIVRPQGDLSLFTYHLGQALRGKAAVRHDGFIRVLDVFDYVSAAVKHENPEQTPILKADDVDGNFAIALDHASGIQKPKPERATPTQSQPLPQPYAPGIYIGQVNTKYNQTFSGHGYTLNFNSRRPPRKKKDH